MIDDVVIYEKNKSRIYIREVRQAERKKTRLFFVEKEDELGADAIGVIAWDGGWWQYVFVPDEDTKWSHGCLENIARFCKQQTDEQKQGWQK